jgi:hypothetical protein
VQQAITQHEDGPVGCTRTHIRRQVSETHWRPNERSRCQRPFHSGRPPPSRRVFAVQPCLNVLLYMNRRVSCSTIHLYYIHHNRFWLGKVGNEGLRSRASQSGTAISSAIARPDSTPTMSASMICAIYLGIYLVGDTGASGRARALCDTLVLMCHRASAGRGAGRTEKCDHMEPQCVFAPISRQLPKS